jgi:hypothetical protein
VVVRARPALPIESGLAITWLAAGLVGLVACRTMIAAVWLRRAADDAGIRERRIALAFCAICLAVYWPAATWRGAHLGPDGDELQYLAATQSLWHEQNLEITNSIISQRLGMPGPTGYRQLDITEDNSRDRLNASTAATAASYLYFPFIGGRGIGATIMLGNPGGEVAGARLTYRDGAGREVATHIVTVEPDRSLSLHTPAEVAA